MANQDASFGLRLRRKPDGTSYNLNKYYISSSYGTALFVGDPVVHVGNTNTAEVTSGDETHDIGTLLEINKASAGDANAITGVIVAFEADPSNTTRVHNPASTERVAIVCDDPTAEYEIQGDGIVALDDVGLNANLIFTNSGSTVTGLSGVELDTSCDAPAADASNQLLILRYSEDPNNNDATAANGNVIVKINQSTLAANEALGIA